MPLAEETKPYRLTEREVKLVELCRECGYGQLVIHLKNGQPVRVEEIRKSIEL